MQTRVICYAGMFQQELKVAGKNWRIALHQFLPVRINAKQQVELDRPTASGSAH
jgi:hypothetical protein